MQQAQDEIASRSWFLHARLMGSAGYQIGDQIGCAVRQECKTIWTQKRIQRKQEQHELVLPASLGDIEGCSGSLTGLAGSAGAEEGVYGCVLLLSSLHFANAAVYSHGIARAHTAILYKTYTNTHSSPQPSTSSQASAQAAQPPSSSSPPTCSKPASSSPAPAPPPLPTLCARSSMAPTPSASSGAAPPPP